tara:strand:+ start:202 stop:399 length:198 start_codon:yes stop_codon:yes gene_type:complete
MADKITKTRNSKPKYKAVDPKQFEAWYNSNVPCYEELSAGEAVELNTKNKTVSGWLGNKIIIKEI